ncbi:MAG: type sorting protein [Cytophagaceae bacterium]|jgi:chitinase|nr:type sorting protein [Cytophagaceae bacterium]
MKRHLVYLRALIIFGLVFYFGTSYGQLPCKVLVGYYQSSWGTNIRLKDVNSNYNVICLSFLEANGGDGNSLNNVVDNLSFYARQNSLLIADIPVVQAEGRKVLMSIGGANGSFKLNSAADVTTFVDKVKAVIQTYKVDGIDIDLEQNIYLKQSGTISNPSAHIANLITGLQQLLDWYQATYSKKMILTMVPETAYVTGGLSQYQTDAYGVAYLPIIEALRDDLDLLMVQLYNAGENIGLDGVTYTNGNADYIISQTEAIIKGFTCKSSRGTYSGLPASKVVVTLPAESGSAGSGYVTPAVAKSAINYLLGVSAKPGTYTLQTVGGYPDLRGMATWSINNDYDGGHTFAANYATIFSCVTTGIEQTETIEAMTLFPNPAQQQITIENNRTSQNETRLQIVSMIGEVWYQQELTEQKTTVDVSTFPKGLYLVKIGEATQKLVIQ